MQNQSASLKTAATASALRVFLSSTFDESMRVNRDTFRHEINARLNQMFGALDYNVYLYDLELGIPDAGDPAQPSQTPRQSSQERTLAICYDRIKECDFFICVIGFNYGSVLSDFLHGAGPLLSPYRGDIEAFRRSGIGITESELMLARQESRLVSAAFIHEGVMRLTAADADQMQRALELAAKAYREQTTENTPESGPEQQLLLLGRYFQWISAQQDEPGSSRWETIRAFTGPVYQKLKDRLETAVRLQAEHREPQEAAAPAGIEAFNTLILENIRKTIQLKDTAAAQIDYALYQDTDTLLTIVPEYFQKQLNSAPRFRAEQTQDESVREKHLIHAQKTRYYIPIRITCGSWISICWTTITACWCSAASRAAAKARLTPAWTMKSAQRQAKIKRCPESVGIHHGENADVCKDTQRAYAWG